MVPHAMVVVVIVTVALGAVLLWALQHEQVPPRPSPPPPIRWTGVPGPAEVRRTDFGIVVAGYDPAAVDAHLRALAAVIAALQADDADPGPVPEEPVPEEPVPEEPVADELVDGRSLPSAPDER
jgi:DivIVA domain-containing protein